MSQIIWVIGKKKKLIWSDQSSISFEQNIQFPHPAVSKRTALISSGPTSTSLACCIFRSPHEFKFLHFSSRMSGEEQVSFCVMFLFDTDIICMWMQRQTLFEVLIKRNHSQSPGWMQLASQSAGVTFHHALQWQATITQHSALQGRFSKCNSLVWILPLRGRDLARTHWSSWSQLAAHPSPKHREHVLSTAEVQVGVRRTCGCWGPVPLSFLPPPGSSTAFSRNVKEFNS